MAESNRSLHDLCRRVAAGDHEARVEFSRDVAPLVEIIARRWLSTTNRRRAAYKKTESAPLGDPSPRNASKTACDAAAAGLARRICRSLIEKIGEQGPRPTAETLVRKLLWPTEVGPVAD